METRDAIFTRRSVRDFDTRPVPDEILDQVLQAAVAAPSGGNQQAWAFVLVRSAKRLAALRALAPGVIGQPAALVAICLDRRGAGATAGGGIDPFLYLDAGAALENMLLAAHSLDLGACPVGSFHKAAVAAFLGLPPGVSVILLMALGSPRTRPSSPGRRPLREVVFKEEWGAHADG